MLFKFSQSTSVRKILGGNVFERVGVQLSLFPTEEEQIRIIDEAESKNELPFAFSVPRKVIFKKVFTNTEKIWYYKFATQINIA